MKKGMTFLSILALSVLLLQGCGQKETKQGNVGSFSDGVVSGIPQSEYKEPEPVKEEKTDEAQKTGTEQRKNADNRGSVTPDVKVKPSQSDKASKSVPLTKEIKDSSTPENTSPSTSSKPVPQPGKVEGKAKNKTADAVSPTTSSKAGNASIDNKNKPAASAKTAAVPAKKEETKKAAKDKGNTSKSSAVKSHSTPHKKSGVTEIGWNGFFDGDDQTTPSEQFWDLSGSTVKIRGFMGEVLSFEKHWLLLIPEPGAECPFDNGDETYWNKIMIVFVPDDVKLRYKSGALEVTGRLDVGIKIDESGYKTMFRLYDASIKEIKE